MSTGRVPSEELDLLDRELEKWTEWRVMATGRYRDNPETFVELKRFDTRQEAENYAAYESTGRTGAFAGSVHIESRQAGPWERWER